jgi:hypothetical protein
MYANEAVSLDGSGSSDPEGQPITFQWSIVSAPDGSYSEVGIACPCDPHVWFFADTPELYVVSLVVNDGVLDSPPSTMTVTVISLAVKAAEELSQVITLINTLPDSDFKNPKQRNALTNKISLALQYIEQGLYQEADDVINNDVFVKLNGCLQKNSACPDKNDMIITLDAQKMVGSALGSVLRLLREVTVP